MKLKAFLTFIAIMNLIAASNAGILAMGICYAGCGALVTACFGAAGFVFGTVPGAQIAAVPALVSCNSAFATCMAACSAAVVLPTP